MDIKKKAILASAILLVAGSVVLGLQLHNDDVYLPLIMRQYKSLGVQVWNYTSHNYQIDNGISLVPVWFSGDNRHEGILPDLDGEIILGFRYAPEEWRDCNEYELECCPPAPEYYDDYGALLATELENILSTGNDVIAVEIWNEPDVSEAAVNNYLQHYLGCWGDTVEAGQKYARLLSEVYPRIKAVDPDIVVLAGGLYFANSAVVPDFWTGVGSANHDAVSFHSYSRWPANNWQLAQEKVNTLRTVTNKPLWLTETSLLCNQDCTSQFEDDQADYLRYLLSDVQVDTLIWFTLANNYWENSDLVHDNRIKPVYNVYRNFLQEVQ